MTEAHVDRALLVSLDGETYMRRMLQGTIPVPAMWETSNISLDHVARGEIWLSATALPAHGNIIGTVHGGWYGTVLDACMGCACMSCVPTDATHATLEYKVNITRPAPIGLTLEARGKVQHAGKRTVVAMGEIRGKDDGKIYATGTTTCIILPAG